MKIGWINDYDTNGYLGGTQLTNDIMIQEGRDLGYEIDLLLPETKDFLNYDFYIINNNICFSDLYIDLIKRKKYICYIHDYETRHRWGLLENSLLNIFLSPLHKQTYRDHYGVDVPGKCIPSPVKIKQKKTKKGNFNLFIGEIARHKGVEELLNREDIFFIGRPRNTEYVEKMGDRYLGYLPYDETINYLRKAKKFVFKPEYNEPCGRVVIEALFCGCELEVNKNIGALSYERDIKQLSLSAPTMFWTSIKEVINDN